MQVCTSLQTDNYASTQFLQAGCPSCHPTNSIKALKAHCCEPIKKNIHLTAGFPGQTWVSQYKKVFS